MEVVYKNDTLEILLEVAREEPYQGASFLEVVSSAIDDGGNVLYALAQEVKAKAFTENDKDEHARLLNLADRLHNRIRAIQLEREATSQVVDPPYPRRKQAPA